MQFLKTIFKDILYVSKITGTQRKKVLILTSVVCSQLAILVDVFLIGLFAYLIADQKTNIVIAYLFSKKRNWIELASLKTNTVNKPSY